MTRFIKTSLYFLLLVSLICCESPDIGQPTPPVPDNKDTKDTLAPIIGNVVVGYATHWEKTMPEPALLTHINYAFAYINEDLESLEIQNEDRLTKIVSLKSRYPELKVLLSIGGFEDLRFSDMAADSTHRKAFSHNCLDEIKKNDLDGINLDWECPTDSLTPLLQELRETLGPKRLLTISSSADAAHIDFKSVVEHLNFVNIMAYDMGEPPYHNAGLYPSSMTRLSCSESIELHNQAGVPYKKMVLGIPFYGVGNGVELSADGVDFKDVPKKELAKKGYVKCWDDIAQVPYLENTSGEMAISYDDEVSVGLKVDYILTKGLLGAMYWNLEADDYAWSLSKEISSRLLNEIHEGQEDEVDGIYQVTNSYMQDFMDKVQYPDGDYSFTLIHDFPGGGPGRADLPQSVILKWKKNPKAVTLKVWEEGWSREYKLAYGATKQELVNLVPNVTYEYMILDRFGGVLKQDTFRTTGSIHQLFFPPEVRNTRDLGGWKTLDGKTVSYRKLYRGGAVGGLINDKGKEEWRAEGIKAELDLREASSSPAVSPVGEDIDYIRPGFPGGYKGMLTDYQEGIKQCFEFIAKCLREDKPVLYHCTAGRDRTGTMSILILGLLGVSDGDISKEYELTYFAPEDWSIWLSRDPDKFLHTRSLKGYFDASCRYIWSYGQPTFAGCVEQYLLSAGVSQTDLDDIRRILLKE